MFIVIKKKKFIYFEVYKAKFPFNLLTPNWDKNHIFLKQRLKIIKIEYISIL